MVAFIIKEKENDYVEMEFAKLLLNSAELKCENKSKTVKRNNSGKIH